MSLVWNASRRDFLKTGAILGSGLVIGFYLPDAKSLAQTAGQIANHFAPNAWLSIEKDEKVTIWVAKSEMGQGVRTSLPMLVAEELETDWANVTLEQAPADEEKYGDQVTGGSTSVRDSWESLRKAGATAREMLITAAAQTWNVKRASCHAENGNVIHRPTSRKLSYGELATAAARLPVPKKVSLKDVKDFRLLGRSILRLDTPEKVDGTAIYGIDVRTPGMFYAAVARCPFFGGRIARYDASKAKLVPGVRHIVQIDSGVAAVADTTWAALKGREAIGITLDEGSGAKVSTGALRKEYEDLIKKTGSVARSEGTPFKVIENSSRRIEALYELPYQAHAAMEPLNCTADVRKDSCEIWAPTQVPGSVQAAAAQITGLPVRSVKVNVTLLGGGFGRRLQKDDAMEAVQISKEIKAPVKVVWSREDDLQHDFYRPNSYHHLSAALDENGIPLAWTHRIVAPSILGYQYPSEISKGIDKSITDEPSALPYRIPHLHVDWVMANHCAPNMPLGWWRSVYSSQNAFAEECFVDEMAAVAAKDPLEFRLQLLTQAPRHKRVLELVAAKAGWGTSPPAGRSRGIAVYFCFGSYVALVAEVSVNKDGNIRVHRVVCAIDCGMTVNPSIIDAQMQSSVVFGLTAALKGEITLENGRVEQTNFHDYEMLRIEEMPVVETYIVSSKEPPGGVGEPGVPVVAPSIANAVFAATGKRIRRLPIRPKDLVHT